MSLAVLGVLALGGCGGGQIAGQEATTTGATQAATSPTTATPATTAPATGTPKPAKRRSTTDPSPTSTSTTPATTQPPASTTPSTTAKHRKKASKKPAADPGTPIDETAQLSLVSKQSATEYTQRGTVTGTYDGEMELTAKITNAGIAVRFTVTTPEGTVTGRGLAIVRITGAALEPITGTAAITGGSGRFAGFHGNGLTVKGRVALDATRGVVHLTGTVFS